MDMNNRPKSCAANTCIMVQLRCQRQVSLTMISGCPHLFWDLLLQVLFQHSVSHVIAESTKCLV